jgi:hypothetical protein
VVYSTRNYGRFGAYAPAMVEPQRPLRLRYRIVVWHGEHAATASVATCAELFADYATPAVVTVVTK